MAARSKSTSTARSTSCRATVPTGPADPPTTTPTTSRRRPRQAPPRSQTTWPERGVGRRPQPPSAARPKAAVITIYEFEHGVLLTERAGVLLRKWLDTSVAAGFDDPTRGHEPM